LNGDGKPEVFVAKSNSGVLVYQNTSASGNIVLASPVNYYTSSSYSAAMSDLDGDNLPDLAVANFTSETVSILKNQVTYPGIVLLRQHQRLPEQLLLSVELILQGQQRLVLVVYRQLHLSSCHRQQLQP